MAKSSRAPRLPVIEWREIEKTSTGNEQWQSRDGMLRLVHSNSCYGVAMPSRWVLWQYRKASWIKAAEGRGRGAIEKRARQIAAEYETDSED